MISTGFYKGQGLGNQLWCYITTRVLARDKGLDFGIKTPENFVGKDLFDLDFGKPVEGIRHEFVEKSLVHPLNGSDIRGFDERIRTIEDGTDLVGLFQDENFIRHRKSEIKQWFKVKAGVDCRDYSSDDICVINFRGGGYVFDVDFFLPGKYWQDAIAHMRTINPKFKFVVVTDDVKTGKKFFPDFEVNHWNPAKDFAVIKNAHYLIASNSSFAYFPALISDDLKYAIGPKYWARYNISDGYWSLSSNIFDGWHYLDRTGKLFEADECRRELDAYIQAHPALYSNTEPFRPSFSKWIRNNAHIFGTLRKDIGSWNAFMWLAHARGLRGAIWAKDRLDKMRKGEMPWQKNIKRIARKILVHGPREIKDYWIEWRAKRSWLTPEGITEYRKRIKIYDIFTFFNELDLLEIRLDILGPYVDHFAIVEACETFSGIPKPLHFKENAERYKKWAHKIIYYVIDDVPKNAEDFKARLNKPKLSPEDRRIIEWCFSTNIIDHSKDYWVKEFYMKESIRKALTGLHDDDICYISDADEIWDPKLLIDYSKNDIFRLRQRPYMYYLNNRSDEHWQDWTGTSVTKYRNIKDQSINILRSHKSAISTIPLHNAGWHFNFLGGAEGARRKLVEAAHPFYKNDRVLPGLADAVAANRDHRGKNVKLWRDESDLPKYLLDNKEKWKRFFL